MNKTIITDATKAQFDIAVRNFTPELPRKFQMLMPFKEGIAELKRRGASYAVIAEILRNINVAVSVDTVARFCREILELSRASRARRKKSVRSSRQRPRNEPRPSNGGDHAARGPRVADPNNI